MSAARRVSGFADSSPMQRGWDYKPIITQQMSAPMSVARPLVGHAQDEQAFPIGTCGGQLPSLDN